MSETVNNEKAAETGRMGMWLFLFSEVLLFGGLFLLYTVMLRRYPVEFHAAGATLNTLAGSVNTVILITSSLTVALAVFALKKNDKNRSLLLLTSTIVLALLFLLIKYFEWSAKFAHGIFPDSPALLELPQGHGLFYSLYFLMTGLHGIHVLIGIFLLLFCALGIRDDRITADNVIVVNSGLYWHLVDVIWIFLFPLFYLIT